MNIAIITGGSKGIGKALCKKYFDENYKVYSLARSSSDNKHITSIKVDLTNPTETSTTFQKLLKTLENEHIESLTLINNAGRLGKISNLENIPSEDITKTMNLNVTTPMILSSLCIAFGKRTKCIQTIINISSGAATKPYSGWSCYCSSKAAIDMLTQTIFEEQKDHQGKLKVFGIRPGVVDTNMQTSIRNTDSKDFSLKQRFVSLKENNQLFTPEYVAETIFESVSKNKLIPGEVVDIRDFT